MLYPDRWARQGASGQQQSLLSQPCQNIARYISPNQPDSPTSAYAQALAADFLSMVWVAICLGRTGIMKRCTSGMGGSIASQLPCVSVSHELLIMPLGAVWILSRPCSQPILLSSL